MLYSGGVNNATQFEVNLACYHTGYSGPGLVFLSAFGLSSLITNVTRSLKKKCVLRVNWNSFTMYPKTFEVLTSKMPESEYTHMIIYRKDEIYCNEGKDTIRFFAFIPLEQEDPVYDSLYEMANSGNYPQALIDTMYDKLYKMSPAPVIKEWMPFLLDAFINTGEIQILRTIRSKQEKPLKCIMFDVSVEDLVYRISRGLRNGAITIGGANEVSPFMSEVQGIDAYLNEYSELLTAKIQKSFVPRFIPGQDQYNTDLKAMIDYTKYSDHIELYPAQTDVAQAVSNALDHNKVAWIISEMGSGKTTISITAINTHRRTLEKNTYRQLMNNIVMCPGHLVGLWKREIEARSPNSEAIIIKNFEQLVDLLSKIKGNHRHKHLWLILSQETAKFGYTMRPSAIWRSSRKVPGEPKHGVYCCPKCGQPLSYDVYTGTGRRKRKMQHYLDETDFREQSIKNNNLKCTNLVPKYNSETGNTLYVPCDTYLWGPNTKETLYDGKDETRWIKTKAGWMQHMHIRTVRDRLVTKSETEALTNDEVKLLTALNDELDDNSTVQVTPRKYPISKYIKKYLKGWIDYVIFDEVQQLKSRDSLQGQSFGDLIQVSKYSLALTGTLLNGYASGIYYLLFKSFSRKMFHEGYEFNDIGEFIKDYGVTKKSTWYELGRNGTLGDTAGKSKEKELPGISPIVFTKFLLKYAVFLSLEDISEALPAYEEIPVPVDMSDDLSQAYNTLEESMSQALGASENSHKWLSQAVQLLSVYPDQPYDQAPVYDPETNELILVPTELTQEYREKEYTLLDIVQRKLENEERVLIYYSWTNKSNVAERLTNLLTEHGISCATLTTSIKSADREEWINQQIERGVQVLLCNPKLVETGLSLLDFTTIIFYQLNYNLFTMRQASRRSWRINQDHDIQVYFLYYKSTVQEQALSLMATKLQASMSIEGKFSEEGLSAMSNNEDILTQIANSVTEGIKNTLDIQVFQKTKVTSHKKQSEVIQDIVTVEKKPEITPYNMYRPITVPKEKSNTLTLLDSLYSFA